MDLLNLDLLNIAAFIGKGVIVCLGLVIAVIAWRWRQGHEVKHAPKQAAGYVCETVTERISQRAAERGR